MNEVKKHLWIIPAAAGTLLGILMLIAVFGSCFRAADAVGKDVCHNVGDHLPNVCGANR